MADFVKTKRHVLTDTGYKDLSQWTNAESVEMNDGTSVQTEITNLKKTATTSANGLMSSGDKTKLETIETSANNYTHPSYTSYASALRKFAVDATGHVSSTAAVAKSDITALGIPATDTTYAAATTGANGLMSSGDKTKLETIETSANNYTHPTYTSAASALRKVTVDGTGHVSGTASVAKSDITALGIPGSDTTYAAVTTGANGLMTSTDKTKLDSVAASANNYTHPSYTSYANGLYKITVNNTGHVSGTASVAKSDITALGIPGSDTTYAVATSTANGLMSSGDKSKLTGIESGAQVNTITGVKGNEESSYRTGQVNITPANIGAIATSARGANSGVAPLNANGVIDSTYLPSYVDDVLEYPTRSDFPATGESGKIYVDISKEDNNTYRWSGSTYILIAKNTNTTYTISKNGSTITLTGSDGSTSDVTDANTTYAAADTSNAGLMPKLSNDAAKYLNGKGQWTTPPGTEYDPATQTADGLMSSADKTKLDSVAASANNYTHPSYTSAASGLYKVKVDATGHVSGTTAVAKADITALGIPGSNTTYAVATTAANGLMSSGDKTKLDTVETSANNYSHPTYTSAASALRKVTVDGTGHVSGTAAVAKSDITALGIPGSDTTYAAVTTGANGLMTSTDKTKLDSVAASANNYVHPTYTSAASGLYKVKVDNTGHVSGTTAVAKSDITGLGIPGSDTTYAAVTSNANGLMTSTDKTKLDSVATSANNYTHPSYTSYASGMRKFTVDATGHVSATAAINKSDITALGIPGSDTTYAAMGGATTAAAGTSGLVPAPSSGAVGVGGRFLCADGAWKIPTGTTYAVATSTANGLMSSTDKGKLDSVAASANNYVHPTYTSAASALRKVTVDGTGHVSGTAAVVKSDITTLGIPGSDTTYAVADTTKTGLMPVLNNDAAKYLNGKGQWATPPGTEYDPATQTANGLMSSADKTKLDSVAASANNYSHPTYTSYASALRKVTVDGYGHISGTASVAKSDITALGIPGSDTTYAAVTTGANGLMTSTDKTKLDTVETSANNYSHPTYTSAASALRKVTVDGTGHVSGTAAVAKADITALGIPASDTTYSTFTSAAAGLAPAAKNGSTSYLTSGYVLTGAGWKAGTKYNTDTTYAAVATNANGLMTSTDKTKLDTVETSANNYTHPTYTSYASALRKFTVDGTGHVSSTAAVAKSDITALGIPSSDTTYTTFTSAAAGLAPAAKSGTTDYATSGYVLTGAGWKAGTKYNTDTNTTYAAVTTGADGLMTSTDKTKLDSVAASANNYTHPTYTSAASALRKVTVDGTGHVSGTAAVAKADITALGIPDSDTTYSTFTSAAAGLAPAAKNGSTSYLTSGYVLTGAGWKAGTKYNTDTNTTYAAVTTGADGLMTSTDKTKLDSVAASANNYTHPSYTSYASGMRKFTVDATGHVSGTAAVEKSDITALGIPGSDTTYAGATTGANGLMTSTDKTKLDSVAASANNYSHPTYTSYASGMRKFTVDATGHVSATAAVAKADITALGIPGSDTTYSTFTSAAAGLAPAAKNGSTSYLTTGYVLTGAGWQAGTKYNTDTNTTYAAVTTGANGLMTSTDKTKLDSVAASANNYTHPSYTSYASGMRKFTVDATGHVSGTAAVEKSDITALGIPDSNTTYSTFTSAAAGLAPAAKNGSTSYLTSGYVLTGAGWKAGTKYNTDTDTTYAVFSSNNTDTDGSRKSGLVPAASTAVGDVQYLNGMGNWSNPVYTIGAFTGATQTSGGATGFVPGPSAGTTGASGRFLSAGGEWLTPDPGLFGGVSTTTQTGTKGLVPGPQPGSLERFLCATGNWEVISLATTAGKGLINTLSGNAGQYLNGTGAWSTPTNTTYSTFTSSANGLVPAAKNGTTSYLTSGYVLTGAGWKAGTKYNTDTTYSNFTSATSSAAGSAGLAPGPGTAVYDAYGALSANEGAFLSWKGTWNKPIGTTYATNASGVKAVYNSSTSALTLTSLSVRV